MEGPSMRGTAAAVSQRGPAAGSMKGEAAFQAPQQPAAAAHGTGRRWTTWGVLLLPAFCLIALCLVLAAGPSGRPAVLTDVMWRSVARPLVILRRQPAPDAAQQWGDPLAFASRPRPLEQNPQAQTPALDAGAAASGGRGDDDSVPAAAATHASAPAPAPALAAGEQGAATSAAAAQRLPAGEPVDWAACLREDDTDTPFTVQDFVAARPARMKVEAVFHSRHPRAATAVTMFVIATTSRQDYLDDLCASYGSVITLAYYIAVPENATDPAAVISADIDVIKQKFDQMEEEGKCQIDVLIVSERVKGAAAKLFPINVLRNLAMLTARTELVMLGDLDMLIGTDLREVVTSEDKYQQLLGMTADRHLVVVPTFQTWEMEYAHNASEGGKAAAARMWDGEHLRYFLEKGFEPAHQDTDFPRWLNATQPYELNNTHELFEPWWIARRADIIPYDVRYRGYGKNKLQHLHEAVNDLGFRYTVHPSAYMVHRPHPESAAKQQFDADVAEMKAKEAAGAPMAADEESHFSLFGTAQRWLDEQFATPPPHRILVTAGWRRCRDTLPFWDVYGSAGEPMQTVTSLEQLVDAAPAPAPDQSSARGTGDEGSPGGGVGVKQEAEAAGSDRAPALPSSPARRLLGRRLAALWPRRM